MYKKLQSLARFRITFLAAKPGREMAERVNVPLGKGVQEGDEGGQVGEPTPKPLPGQRGSRVPLLRERTWTLRLPDCGDAHLPASAS